MRYALALGWIVAVLALSACSDAAPLPRPRIVVTPTVEMTVPAAAVPPHLLPTAMWPDWDPYPAPAPCRGDQPGVCPA
jgi:hypothetical protein